MSDKNPSLKSSEKEKSSNDAKPTISSTKSASVSGSTKVNQAAFIHKLYNMLEDGSIKHLITWTPTNDSFVILPGEEFSKVLSQYFKHTNVSSFVRQLNMYGFHKVNDTFHTSSNSGSSDQAQWEFKHGAGSFKRGDTEALRGIKRRTSRPSSNHRDNVSLKSVSLSVPSAPPNDYPPNNSNSASSSSSSSNQNTNPAAAAAAAAVAATNSMNPTLSHHHPHHSHPHHHPPPPPPPGYIPTHPSAPHHHPHHSLSHHHPINFFPSSIPPTSNTNTNPNNPHPQQIPSQQNSIAIPQDQALSIQNPPSSCLSDQNVESRLAAMEHLLWSYQSSNTHLKSRFNNLVESYKSDHSDMMQTLDTVTRIVNHLHDIDSNQQYFRDHINQMTTQLQKIVTNPDSISNRPKDSVSQRFSLLPETCLNTTVVAQQMTFELNRIKTNVQHKISSLSKLSFDDANIPAQQILQPTPAAPYSHTKTEISFSSTKERNASIFYDPLAPAPLPSSPRSIDEKHIPTSNPHLVSNYQMHRQSAPGGLFGHHNYHHQPPSQRNSPSPGNAEPSYQPASSSSSSSAYHPYQPLKSQQSQNSSTQHMLPPLSQKPSGLNSSQSTNYNGPSSVPHSPQPNSSSPAGEPRGRSPSHQPFNSPSSSQPYQIYHDQQPYPSLNHELMPPSRDQRPGSFPLISVYHSQKQASYGLSSIPSSHPYSQSSKSPKNSASSLPRKIRAEALHYRRHTSSELLVPPSVHNGLSPSGSGSFSGPSSSALSPGSCQSESLIPPISSLNAITPPETNGSRKNSCESNNSNSSTAAANSNTATKNNSPTFLKNANSISSVLHNTNEPGRTSPLHLTSGVSLPPILGVEQKCAKNSLSESDGKPSAPGVSHPTQLSVGSGVVTSSMSNPMAPQTLVGKAISNSRHSSSVQLLLNPTDEDKSNERLSDQTSHSPRLNPDVSSPSTKVLEFKSDGDKQLQHQKSVTSLPNLASSMASSTPPLQSRSLFSPSISAHNSPSSLRRVTSNPTPNASSAVSTVAAAVSAATAAAGSARGSPIIDGDQILQALATNSGAIDEPERKRLRVN